MKEYRESNENKPTINDAKVHFKYVLKWDRIEWRKIKRHNHVNIDRQIKGEHKQRKNCEKKAYKSIKEVRF